MNIQPSVIVWTVICFLLLMVVLKNLLFKPVLFVLDARKKKIEDAEQKLRDIERITAENERSIAEKKARAEAENEILVKEKVQQIQSQGKKKIERDSKMLFFPTKTLQLCAYGERRY